MLFSKWNTILDNVVIKVIEKDLKSGISSINAHTKMLNLASYCIRMPLSNFF